MKYRFRYSRLHRFVLVLVSLMIFAGCGLIPPVERHERTAPSPVEVQRPVVEQVEPVHETPQTVDVALALPLSGPYGVIASKIRQGADTARNVLLQRGITMRVYPIDTDQPDWMQQLQRLPDSVKIVGGPLRPDNFTKALQSGATRQRVFFTFLQDLGGAVEGQDAWRFFSSPSDQMRTLLQTARNEFSIYNVGVLYPDEPFGKRIVQLFLDEAKKEGITVAAMKAYPPEDPLRWSELVAELLYSNQAAPIDAVFLPDVWSKVEMLVPYFFYHQREDLIIMGSTLWGQTLTKERNVDVHNFRLSIFPGAWWEGSNTLAARDLRTANQGEEPGFWEVLGYDFVRFASRLGSVSGAWTPEEVNQRIRSAQSMEWSMAPISWSAEGIAEQDMFLFTPDNGGMRPASLQDIRQRRQALQVRLQY